MVKHALLHFSSTHENARKNQTPISGPTMALVRKKQATLKALAMARSCRDAVCPQKLGRCRGSQECCQMRETSRSRLAEKAEIVAAKGDTRELFRVTRKMAPPQRLPTQTVRQCCPLTSVLGERCWTQDEEPDARTQALEYILEGVAGESPTITVDDPNEQATETTEGLEGPFDVYDVVKGGERSPELQGGSEHCQE